MSYFNFKIEQLKQPCFSTLTFKVKCVPKNLYVFNILLSCKYFRVLVSISLAFLQLISTHMLKKNLLTLTLARPRGSPLTSKIVWP